VWMATKKVVILGGGIGGLTVAHQLSKFPEYQISIYEAKDVIGGLARSSREPIGGCATEYCWRVFFGFYNSLLGMMREIPTERGKAIDELVVYKHINVMKPLSFQDQVVGYASILAGLVSCDERLDQDDRYTWWEALGAASDSNLFREIGGWLGMDRFKGSYKSVIKIGIEQQIIPSYLDPGYKDYVTARPTSEALFDPWKRYLESKGVMFHLGTSAIALDIEGDAVKSVLTLSSDGKEMVAEADYFVLALPVEVLEIVLKTSNIDPTKFPIENISKLREGCLHVQLSFQLYFDRHVSLGDHNAFLLVESPWDLIVLSYDSIYQTEICRTLPRVKGAWSVAACTAYVPGILFGKTMAECNEEEIKQELWAQLSQSSYLQALVSQNNPFELTDDIVVGWAEMWPTYDPNGGSKYHYLPPLRTSEPKFTNNAGSSFLRPSFQTYLHNTFISTGYIKETIDIFSMEAAAIAGKRVATSIDHRSPEPVINPRPQIFASLRNVDGVMYSLGLPNVVTIFFIVAFIIFFLSTTSYTRTSR
jgi:15-cis-phytoene desaturase